jgi:hypothetical protein
MFLGPPFPSQAMLPLLCAHGGVAQRGEVARLLALAQLQRSDGSNDPSTRTGDRLLQLLEIAELRRVSVPRISVDRTTDAIVWEPAWVFEPLVHAIVGIPSRFTVLGP